MTTPRARERKLTLWARGIAISVMAVALVALIGPIVADVVTGVALPRARLVDAGLGLAAVLGGIALFWFLIRPDESIPPTLDDQITKLRSNLESSSDLIREINAEFKLQVAAAERIKAEAEQNQRLAELNEEQARAVKELVESVQGRASRAGGRQQWLFFLAGLLFAIPTGVVGNFVFEMVKTWLASR